MSPPYQYNVGEIIETHDDKFGIITDRTDAHKFIAIENNVAKELIKSYSNIPIYKVLIDGRISYVNESNIRGAVSCVQSKRQR